MTKKEERDALQAWERLGGRTNDVAALTRRLRVEVARTTASIAREAGGGGSVEWALKKLKERLGKNYGARRMWSGEWTVALGTMARTEATTTVVGTVDVVLARRRRRFVENPHVETAYITDDIRKANLIVRCAKLTSAPVMSEMQNCPHLRGRIRSVVMTHPRRSPIVVRPGFRGNLYHGSRADSSPHPHVDPDWRLFVPIAGWWRVRGWRHWRKVDEPWPTLLKRPAADGLGSIDGLGSLDDDAVWDLGTWSYPLDCREGVVDALVCGKVPKVQRVQTGDRAVPFAGFLQKPSGAKVGYGTGEEFAFVTRVPESEWRSHGTAIG